MILPTMNNDEMTYEAIRITHWLCEVFNEHKPDIIDRFERGTKFPYFQRILCHDDKGNEWCFICLSPSKEYRRKKKFSTFAYTIYDVPPKRTEKSTNAGKGVLLFDPLTMKHFIDTKERLPGSIINDITPHAMNRYTERFLKPAGKGSMDIRRKVENIILRYMHFDLCADLFGDKNAAKHKDDGICPIDYIMHGGGMFRGYMVNDLLIRLSTYVSDDMMYENQDERQREMTKEYYEWKRKGLR